MSRPATVADCLEAVADYLDLSDKAFDVIATMHGEPNPAKGQSVQGDVRLIASWLREHPNVDAAIYSVLDAVEVP